MKATIIKKIEKEVKDMIDYCPTYRERSFIDMLKIANEGIENNQMIDFKEDFYEGVQVWNPETKLKEVYYVKQDDKKLFKDLLVVSQSFVDKLIIETKEKMIYEFKDKLSIQKENIKKLVWYKRLFNNF